MSEALEVKAPPAWRRMAFASDLHLGPEAPATLDAFCRALAALEADALFLLGDVMEAWVGDDAIDDAWLSPLKDALQRWGRPLFVQVGNRDFLLGASALQALRATPLRDITCLEAFGQRAVLVHGDAQCLDDTAYQAFRNQVRQPVWQQTFLVRPLGERRAIAQQMRAASQAAQQTEPYGDLDAGACEALLLEHGARLLIHGHTHRPATHPLRGGTRWVLSDWDHDHARPRGDWLIWDAQGLHREAAGC